MISNVFTLYNICVHYCTNDGFKTLIRNSKEEIVSASSNSELNIDNELCSTAVFYSVYIVNYRQSVELSTHICSFLQKGVPF